MTEGSQIMIWGYDSDNDIWLPICVNSDGELVVSD